MNSLTSKKWKRCQNKNSNHWPHNYNKSMSLEWHYRKINWMNWLTYIGKMMINRNWKLVISRKCMWIRDPYMMSTIKSFKTKERKRTLIGKRPLKCSWMTFYTRLCLLVKCKEKKNKWNTSRDCLTRTEMTQDYRLTRQG